MTGWESTTDEPTSTGDMVWRCACDRTFESLTAVARHKRDCRRYRRHRQNTRLTQFGSES